MSYIRIPALLLIAYWSAIAAHEGHAIYTIILMTCFVIMMVFLIRYRNGANNNAGCNRPCCNHRKQQP